LEGPEAVLKGTTFKGTRITNISPPQILKVPMQCPIALLVQESLREGKALGSEKVKFQDVKFVLNRGEKCNRGFTAFDRN
jgi:hypothetical protein